MKRLSYSILLSLFLFFSLAPGCSEQAEQPVSKAVIEGVFSSGEYPSVIFSYSVSPGIDGNLAGSIINWGKVTISDGEKEVILSGRADDSYMPPYKYFTLDMRGEPGKTYTLTASFKYLYAEATVRMPYPTPIDSLTTSPTDTDSLRAVTLHFTSPDDVPAYYYLTLRPTESRGPAHPCLTGTIRTDLPRRHYSLPVLRPKINLDSTKYKANLKIGEKWIVALNRVEKPVYDFWTAYDNMTLFSSSPFISTSESLPTNLSGGYGVWSPQGTWSLLFEVK